MSEYEHNNSPSLESHRRKHSHRSPACRRRRSCSLWLAPLMVSHSHNRLSPTSTDHSRRRNRLKINHHPPRPPQQFSGVHHWQYFQAGEGYCRYRRRTHGQTECRRPSRIEAHRPRPSHRSTASIHARACIRDGAEGGEKALCPSH